MSEDTPAPARWLLVTLGVICVVLAAVGAVLPVLPTTIFLIAAVACFARSSPKLERKLMNSRLFAPYLPYVVGDEPLPRRARVTAMIGMWVAIVISFAVLVMRDEPPHVVLGALIVMGLIGTVVILRWRRAV